MWSTSSKKKQEILGWDSDIRDLEPGTWDSEKFWIKTNPKSGLMSQHGIQNNFVCVNFELQISNLIHNRSQNSRKSKRRPTSRFLFFWNWNWLYRDSHQDVSNFLIISSQKTANDNQLYLVNLSIHYEMNRTCHYQELRYMYQYKPTTHLSHWFCPP